MFIFCLLFVVRGGAFCAESESGQHTETEKQGVFVLGEIEVIGKAEETENAAVSSVFDEEMKLFTRDDIADAANLLPGVTLSYAGARNEQTLHVRGFDIKHVPIFLDGIPIYVPYDGYPDLGRFITFDLSELLISKGFTSVLYGPNTMGGALNMVSKRPDKLFETNGGAGISSGDTYQVYGNFGTNQNKYYVQGGASYIDSRYFRLSDDFSPVKTEDGGKRENSYTRDKKVNFKIAYTPSDGNEYAFSYINQQGKKGTPVYAGTDTSVTARYWQWPYWDKESYYVTSRTALGTESYFKTRLFYDNFENSLYSFDDDTYSTISKKYAFRSAYDDYSAGGSLEGGTDLFARNMIKVAVHFKKDVHREDNEGHPIQTFKDEIFSLGIEDTIDLSTDFYVIAGADYDFLKITMKRAIKNFSGADSGWKHACFTVISAILFFLPLSRIPKTLKRRLIRTIISERLSNTVRNLIFRHLLRKNWSAVSTIPICSETIEALRIN
jgi:iron complex outermembrane receptor protein